MTVNATAADPKWPGPGLGTPITESERARLDHTSIYPDGRSLPVGSGNAIAGKKVYEEKCSACHGAKGIGGQGGQLISHGALTGSDPEQSVDTYWPFASTLFDFTRRAMPMNAPGSLSNDEVYAVTAYLLNLSGLIADDEDMNAGTLPQVKMPNRDGFVWIDAKRPTRR